MIKIGVCISFDSMEDIEDKVRSLKDEGFDNCQIISWTPSVWTEEERTYFIRTCTQIRHYIFCILVWMGRAMRMEFLRRAKNAGTCAGGVQNNAHSKLM